jgi:hypothetical protein
LRSTFSCRWLITTLAAEPAMATLLVFPHPGKSAESSQSPHPVRGRFRFPGLGRLASRVDFLIVRQAVLIEHVTA